MSARIVCLHMQARMCISEVSREVTATDQRLGKFPGQYLILVPGIACAVEMLQGLFLARETLRPLGYCV